MTIARITIVPSVQPLADPNWRFATAGISALARPPPEQMTKRASLCSSR